MQTWAVLTQKGGSGKSTVAWNLAVKAQHEGTKTVLIDVDAQQSGIRLGNIRGDAPPKIMSKIVQELPRTFTLLRHDDYELTVIDGAPRADRDTLEIAGMADLIIVPVRPSILDLPAYEDTMHLINRAGRLGITVVVMNAVASRTDEGNEAAPIIAKFGRLLPERLGERVDFRRSLTGGKGVIEFAPNSAAAKEINALYEALRNL